MPNAIQAAKPPANSLWKVRMTQLFSVKRLDWFMATFRRYNESRNG